MGIRMIQGLAINPEQVVLSRRVSLRTRIRSTKPDGERAIWLYSLGENHDVWFETQGWLLKEVMRQESVAFNSRNFLHRIVLSWGDESNAEQLDVPIAVTVSPVGDSNETPPYSVDTLFVRLEQ